MKSFVTFLSFLSDSYTVKIRFGRAALVGILPLMALACIPPSGKVSVGTPLPPPNTGGVYMRHYDLGRTGLNPNETKLTPANVGYGTFGRLYTHDTNGAYTYAQPLYVGGVTMQAGSASGQLKNVLLVATADDTLYAFDADSNATLWTLSFQSTTNNVTYLSQSDMPDNCPAVGPKVGITGTPTIDPATNTIYLVAATKQISNSGKTITFAQTIHAVDIATGADAITPKVISAPNWDSLHSNQRGGLVLNNGKLYIPYASQCDNGPYVGTILSYNVSDLSFAGQALAANPPPKGSTDPNPGGGQSGIWMSGMAPAVDADGNLYAATGNGNWDGHMNTGSLGCSVLKFSDLTGPLQVVDYFTPFDFQPMNNQQIDLDVGSGGVMVLPQSSGATYQLVLAAGKTGQVYLMKSDKSNDAMGRLNTIIYNTPLDDSNGINSPNPEPIPSVLPQFIPGQSFSNIVQSWNLNNNASGYDFDGYGPVSGRDGMYGTGAFFNGKLYVGPNGDSLKAYQLVNGKFTTDENGVVMAVDQSVLQFGWPGVTPSISANGTNNGIVWLVDVGNANDQSPAAQEAILDAYDANNLGNGLLYNSERSATLTNKPTEHAGPAVKYASPTVYNGTVYFATKTGIEVYGLLPDGKPISQAPPPPPTPTGGANINLSFDSSSESEQGCPKFTPANEYQFVVQPCGGAYPACETATSLAGGVQGGLEQYALFPVSATNSTQVFLLPGQQYELLPGTNSIPNNGGWTAAQGTATIYTNPLPYTFTVPASGFINVTAKFYCGLATVSSAIPAAVKVAPPQRFIPGGGH